MFNTDFNVK